MYGTNSESKAFAMATPALDVSMTIDNPEAQGRFVEGQEYYLDFTQAPEFVPTPAPVAEQAVENPPVEGNGSTVTE